MLRKTIRLWSGRRTRNRDVVQPSKAMFRWCRQRWDDMPSTKEMADIWQMLYALLAAAVCVFYLTGWYTWAEFRLPLKLFFLAVFVLSVRFWTVPIIVFLIQVQVLFRGRWFQDAFGPLGFLFWLAVPLLFASLISRYRTLQELHGHSSQAYFRRLKTVFAIHHPAKSDFVVTNVRGVFRQLLRNTVLVAVCFIAARTLLGLVPLPVNEAAFETVREFRLTPTGFRLICLSLTLFLVWLIVWLAVNEITWLRPDSSTGINLSSQRAAFRSSE